MINAFFIIIFLAAVAAVLLGVRYTCLLYTSDAADEYNTV